MVTTTMSAERIWELMGRKLSSEASAEELQELDHLLRTHPDLHFSVQTITDLWLQDYTTSSTEDLEAAYDQHVSRMEQKGISLDKESHEAVADTSWQLENPRRRSGRPLKVWAMSIAALVLLGAWWYFIFEPGKPPGPISAGMVATNNAPGEISTQYGARTTQQLPDGSRVWLNAGSKLTFEKNFGESIREVTLTGEAFFDVVKNPAKPFVIHTSTIDIK